jgi:hypothetical protein
MQLSSTMINFPGRNTTIKRMPAAVCGKEIKKRKYYCLKEVMNNKVYTS